MDSARRREKERTVHPVRIIFLGICLLTNMTVGNQSGKRVLLPHLQGEPHMPIGSHTAFVAFEHKGFGGSQGMGALPTFQNKLTKGVLWDWFPLDGDEITISLAPDPFVVATTYDSGIVKIQKHCADFTAISPEYANGTNPLLKAAHVDLLHGTLSTQLMFAGMIATRLDANSVDPVVITAHSWRTGKDRSVTVMQGDIWIGNMKDDFFSPNADPDKPEEPGMNHFLAYYRMGATSNTCHWQPTPPPDPVLPAAAAGKKSTTSAKAAPKPDRNYGIGCSNSNYP
jgi:hypothetical protein